MTRIGYYLINPTNEQHVFCLLFPRIFVCLHVTIFRTATPHEKVEPLHRIKNIIPKLKAQRGPMPEIF